jgi:hypothetical protein
MRKSLVWNAQGLMLQLHFFVPAFLPFCCLLTVAVNGQATSTAAIYDVDGMTNTRPAYLAMTG